MPEYEWKKLLVQGIAGLFGETETEKLWSILIWEEVKQESWHDMTYFQESYGFSASIWV